MEGPEFIRRFLLHIVPSGFVRIRYYGLLANRFRKEKLDRCRELLNVDGPVNADDLGSSKRESTECDADDSTRRCPKCKNGKMVVTALIPRETQLASNNVARERSPP